MPHFDSPIKVPSVGNTLSENCPLSFACANGGREGERGERGERGVAERVYRGRRILHERGGVVGRRGSEARQAGTLQKQMCLGCRQPQTSLTSFASLTARKRGRERESGRERGREAESHSFSLFIVSQ